MQKPHPRVYGSGNSEESVLFAARRGMGIAFSFAPRTLIERFQVLRDCGVGVVDMAFGVGTHEQKGHEQVANRFFHSIHAIGESILVPILGN